MQNRQVAIDTMKQIIEQTRHQSLHNRCIHPPHCQLPPQMYSCQKSAQPPFPQPQSYHTSCAHQISHQNN
uniref:Uncharacterized protein n=1 Tax=Arundo donax TaxID=35708 RepID=A0A0A9FCQ0_ARUDO